VCSVLLAQGLEVRSDLSVFRASSLEAFPLAKSHGNVPILLRRWTSIVQLAVNIRRRVP